MESIGRLLAAISCFMAGFFSLNGGEPTASAIFISTGWLLLFGLGK